MKLSLECFGILSSVTNVKIGSLHQSCNMICYIKHCRIAEEFVNGKVTQHSLRLAPN